MREGVRCWAVGTARPFRGARSIYGVSRACLCVCVSLSVCPCAPAVSEKGNAAIFLTSPMSVYEHSVV